jgi:hypothetical protein
MRAMEAMEAMIVRKVTVLNREEPMMRTRTRKIEPRLSRNLVNRKVMGRLITAPASLQ